MIEQDFTVGELPVVKVAIRSGRVSVEPGRPGRIGVSVDTPDQTYGVQQRGDVIVASGERGGRTYVTVSAPDTVDLEISTASGDVAVASPVGRLEVATASGDVSFDSVKELHVRSASGTVRGNEVEGEARCVTASGDVRIGQAGRRAQLTTASGDITIEHAHGTVSCATLSGGIRIDVLSGAQLNAKSMSGGVRIGIPSRTRLELDANSLSGRIRLPAPNPSQEPPERETSVKVRLVSGDLRIDRIT
ncbi:MAG: DUF4097 family beta strand repeat-containing protein [Acidimicrobiia bacterium]